MKCFVCKTSYKVTSGVRLRCAECFRAKVLKSADYVFICYQCQPIDGPYEHERVAKEQHRQQYHFSIDII